MAKKRNEDKPNKPLEPNEEIHDLVPEEPVDLDSVFDDDLIDLKHGKDSEGVSGVFSSVIRMDADSAVHAPSEIIRGEPLSDSVAFEPIEEFATAHADSDVQIEPIGADDDLVEVVDDVTEDRVLHDEKPHSSSTGGVALPESAIREERIEDDAIDIGDLGGGVIDSSVSLKSFKNLPRSPEKEQILDLDETVESIDEIVEDEIVEVDDAAEFEGDRSDADMVADGASQETEAIDFGDKSVASTQGYDPLVESLESGVRLDDEGKPPSRAKKPAPPPSVEFDDLVVDDVEVEEIAPPRPAKAASMAADMRTSTRRTRSTSPTCSATTFPSKVDEIAAEDVLNESVEPTDIEAPAVVDDLEPGLIEPEPEPVAAPARRGKKVAAAVTAPASDLPYQEPKRGGGWGGVLGGVVAGLVLAVGAGAGVWYAAPDLIPQPNSTNIAAIARSIRRRQDQGGAEDRREGRERGARRGRPGPLAQLLQEAGRRQDAAQQGRRGGQARARRSSHGGPQRAGRPD